MKFWDEFKTFAMRGNVIDLAVAVVMGASFNKIVASLVDGIVMPMLGILCGGINLANKTWVIGSAIIKWGMFLQAIIDFTLISLVIFLAIKAINYLQHKPDQEKPKLSLQEKLLTEILDLMKTQSGVGNGHGLIHMPTMTHQ